MTLADRLIVMNAGNAEQIDTPLEVYERPASTFVAGFIGSPPMNFLQATMQDGAVQVSGGERLKLDGVADMKDRQVTLGVRPEHLFAGAGAGDGDGVMRVAELQVDLIEALGADKLVYGHFGDGPQSCTLRLPGKIAVSVGESLPFGTASEHLHIFDPAPGGRLSLG